MLFRIFSFFAGRARFKLSASDAVRAVNLLNNANVSYYDMCISGDELSFTQLLISKKRTEAILSRGGIEHRTELLGLPNILYLYRHRVGIFIGALLFILICVSSENYFWRIEIKGNERVSDSEILSLLRPYGIYEGAPCRDKDTYLIANECLLKSDELSYMSINIIGSCAEIIVREIYKVDEEDTDTDASTIIAKRSGTVKEIRVDSGTALVGAGDTVFAGQALISGLYSFIGDRYTYTRAKGIVTAHTVRDFSVSVPLVYEEKTLDSVFCAKKSIIFFAKEIKISKYSGNLPPNCDIIERKERVMLFGKIALPLWIYKTECAIYKTEERTISPDEAFELAKRRMGEELSLYEVISREDSTYISKGEFFFKSRAVVSEDIALEIKMFGS